MNLGKIKGESLFLLLGQQPGNCTIENGLSACIYDLVYKIQGEKIKRKNCERKKSVTFWAAFTSYIPEVKMRQKDRIIFRLTVTPADAGGREKEYKIFEGEPSFFNLSRKERRMFVEREIIRVKEFLDQEYRRPRELRV
jgi:hypothetical protein